MKYDLIIWDFNGTIIDDTKVCLDAINSVLKKRNLKLLDSTESMRKVFCFPCIDYYSKLGISFEKEPYEVPADEWVAYYNNHINEVKLYDGVIDTLRAIKKMSIPQIIISASEKGMLFDQLKQFDILDYFDDVLGTDNVYAVGKTSLIKDWLKSNNQKTSLFIGDTDHDYFCSQEIGCDCILFSQGFMSKDRLQKFNVPVIDRIPDIIKYLP